MPVGIVCDEIGGVWIATKSNGVAHVPREELLAALRNRKLQPEITWFDQRHGLGSKHGPFWPYGLMRARDGRIWVATAAGASAIDPVLWKRYRAQSTPPSVLIENCAADGADLEFGAPGNSALELPVGTDWLRIEYNALDYGRPGEASFRYRLRGLSDTWVEAGAETTANLNQLPPGEYEFEVMAANRFGQWSESPATLRLSIPPQWWQTSWFRASSALGVALIFVTGYLLRMRHLKHVQQSHYEVSRRLIQTQESERQRVAAELHDGLGQNLTVVKNRLTTTTGKQGVSDADIEAAAGLVSDTINDVRRMSHNLRPYVLDRLGLTRAIEVMAKEISDSSGLKIDCQPDQIDGLLARENEINLYRVIQESLTNVLKHADASMATVEIRLENQRISVRVEDDGRGFEAGREGDPKRTAGGIGLPGIRERVRIMGGSVGWKSARREGTKMNLEIPTTNS